MEFGFEVKFDLEGQDQLSNKIIRDLINNFYTSYPNFVILAWPGDE